MDPVNRKPSRDLLWSDCNLQSWKLCPEGNIREAFYALEMPSECEPSAMIIFNMKLTIWRGLKGLAKHFLQHLKCCDIYQFADVDTGLRDMATASQSVLWTHMSRLTQKHSHGIKRELDLIM